MLQGIFDAITGIFDTINNIFGFVHAFIDNLVKAVQTFISYFGFASTFLATFPALHVLIGTISIALGLTIALKIVGR